MTSTPDSTSVYDLSNKAYKMNLFPSQDPIMVLSVQM